MNRKYRKLGSESLMYKLLIIFLMDKNEGKINRFGRLA
jgi:hypothetical protein